MLKVLVATLLLIGLAFAAIAVKIIFTRDGEFRKSCGSIDPSSGQRIPCTCGKNDETACVNKESKEVTEFEEITAQ